MHNSVPSIRITNVYRSQPLSVVFACKTATFGPELHIYWSQTSAVLLRMQNSVICTRLSSMYGFQPSSEVLCMLNIGFWTRVANLYRSQTSTVVLGMQYSVLSTRITCLYGSQPLSAVFACKTAPFGAELQVYMGPKHDLLFCACKTAWCDSELLFSIGPSPHLCVLDANQRHSNQNNKSRWVPDITCRFVLEKQRD